MVGRKINKFMILILLIFSFVCLFISDDKFTDFSIFALSALGLKITEYFVSEKHENLLILIQVSVIFNLIGEYLGVFRMLIGYDKFLHVMTPFFFTILVYYYLKDKYKINLIFITIACMSSLLLFWEFFEYFISTFFHYHMAGVYVDGKMVLDEYQDTMRDFIYGFLGSVIAGAYLSIRRKKQL